MIDTHTHIYMPDFEEGGIPAAQRAFAAGVGHLILPNVDVESVRPMLGLHSALPDSTSVALGLHPTEVDAGWRRNLDEIERLMRDAEPCAIGEVGMDMHWDTRWASEQRQAFLWQLAMARERGICVIIHCRDALAQVLDCIDSMKGEMPELIFHSFTGNADDARRVLDVCDAAFGINGVVTFRNAAPLRDALPEIGAGRILLETDSPYLAPVPYRGRRNESAYIVETLHAAAAALAMPHATLEEITDANARRLFQLPAS